MLKRRVNPGRRRASGSPSRRSMRTQNEWNVLRSGAESSGTSSSSATTRSRISRAALLVKVTASTADGGTCREVMMWAMRCVMTRVFPLPAPARISKGPSIWFTASRCCALSPLRKSMKGKRFILPCTPAQSSASYLVRRECATWKWGSVRVPAGLTNLRVSCADRFWPVGAGGGGGGGNGGGGWGGRGGFGREFVEGQEGAVAGAAGGIEAVLDFGEGVRVAGRGISKGVLLRSAEFVVVLV